MVALIPEEDPELSKLTLEKFKAAFEVFSDRIQGQDKRLMCDLFEIYSGPNSLNHNCLGCNFDEMADQVFKFLLVCQNGGGYFSTQQAISIYVFLLNAIWERMGDVFEIISLPKSYLVRYFGAFITARRWANFYKHPKAFAWMVHHPEYTYEGSSYGTVFINDPSYIKVNDEFLKKYYASEKNSKELTGKFSGYENKVVVVLPDIVVLTVDICACLEKFIEILSENKVYREILDEKSTFVDYFSQQDEP
jgi:hypothetical protein